MRRMSFRTRLVIIITAVFIAAGAALLTVQYLVVQQLFSTAITTTEASCLPMAAVLPTSHQASRNNHG